MKTGRPIGAHPVRDVFTLQLGPDDMVLVMRLLQHFSEERDGDMDEKEAAKRLAAYVMRLLRQPRGATR